MSAASNTQSEFPTASRFERKARELLKEAKARGEHVHGIKPWYCSAKLIESGAKVAFVGANPGGGRRAEVSDKKLGVLKQPYIDPKYNAWLDDPNWEDGRELQERAVEAFGILFDVKKGWRSILRDVASFNVVPVRTHNTAHISQATWTKGVDWFLAVLEHIAPSVVVCNGNQLGKSAWSALKDHRFGVEEQERIPVYGTYYLKRGRILNGKLAGRDVVALPHLSYVKSLERLRAAARKLGSIDVGD